MIKVKRYSPEELGINEDLIKKLATETEKAIAHYNEEIEKFQTNNFLNEESQESRPENR